jgi:hypothetical protein
MALLSKSKLKIHSACSRKLWLTKYQPEQEVKNPQLELIAKRGTEFGQAVLCDFPDGKLIETLDTERALAQTASIFGEFSRGAPVCPVFEAAFEYDDVIIRIDILSPVIENSQITWDLIEVKSGQIESEKADKVSKTPKFDEYLMDAAIQRYIATHAGLSIKAVKIGVPNKNFILATHGDYHGLLKCYDVNKEADYLIPNIKTLIADAKQILAQTSPPQAAIDSKCSNCGFLNFCTGAELKPHEAHVRVPTWYLGGSANVRKVQDAMPLSRDLAEIDDKFLTKKIHQQMKQVALNNKNLYIDHKLRDFLLEQPWPRYFLDFEFISSPVPIWRGTNPSTTIPFQFSLHKWSGPGEYGISHYEYLSENPDQDPRGNLAKALLAALDDGSNIYTWSGKNVEGPIISKLTHFVTSPADVKKLELITASCVQNDLLPWFQEYFYVLGMRGRSIKEICKYFLPQNPYDSLTAKNGVDAMNGYERFMSSNSIFEKESIKNELLEYCKVDTKAMILIWQHIIALPEPSFS